MSSRAAVRKPSEVSEPTARPKVALVVKIAALGGAGGAIAGAVAVSIWLLIFQFPIIGALPSAILLAGLLGASFGVVLLPLAGFTLLRVIPLWRILLFTIIGAAGGGVVGAQHLDAWFFAWPIGGFAAAVLWLTFEAQRRVRARGIGVGLAP